jgi:hypothetical protein
LTVHLSAKELGISFPEIPSELDSPTAKSIYNAWMETAIIDNYGMVWVLPKRLSEILRTSKSNARYITDRIGRQYKSEGAAGTCAIYPQLSTSLWNGLIVNQNIHQIITNEYVNDENELYDLCLKQKWFTKWYDDYLNSIG